jgi:hypothetical protein
VAPQLSVPDLQRRLGHAAITFAVHDHESPNVSWASFTVHPLPNTSDALEFVFDRDVLYLQSLHFGPQPHWHFDSSEDATVNCNRAVRIARALVHRRIHMVQQLDVHGHSWGWSLHTKTSLPLVYDHRITHYRRVFFSRPSDPSLPIPSECRRPVLGRAWKPLEPP